MDFVVLIPSYDRPKILRDKTLAFLKKHNVPNHKIFVFLRDQNEFDYYNLNEYNIVLTGATGIEDTRNYLQHWAYTSDYDKVIYMDDDIKDIYEMKNPVDNFIEFGNNLLKEIDEKGLSIGGICPYKNTFYMKPSTTTTLKYIIGCFRAEIIRRDKPIIECTMDQFEDMEFTCRYFLRDGGVLRKNGYCLNTKYFNPIGGICGSMGGMEERQKKMDINSKKMMHMFPKMCRVVNKKTGKDIRLNHNYKI